MKKGMNEIRVETSENGNILIIQPTRLEDDLIISITPEQVDVLVTWLKEVKEEITREKPKTTDWVKVVS